ncbi:unnamed protein product, partial [Mesorhabditis belari]|uniref:Uncharacterized protein n=1 Tax=Mesorhabditis belari TaxID=2138241 RepID=A0AAF3EPE0_9BILA
MECSITADQLKILFVDVFISVIVFSGFSFVLGIIVFDTIHPNPTMSKRTREIQRYFTIILFLQLLVSSSLWVT